MRFFILIISIVSNLAITAQDFEITDVYIKKDEELKQLVFTIEVEGIAGDSVPTAVGSLNGAPVLGYVFPTNLNSTDVGFDSTDGIVAFALTSHPDFDDTPLWDENNDLDYANDGVIWHPHWVLLENNVSVPGGLAVKATTETSILPPTNPGMPMYMDSPGFQVVYNDNRISCTVPLYRINNRDDFSYDGVTVYMEVNTSDPSLPMLGVYEIYSIASGDLSLPYSIGNHSCDTLVIDISIDTGIGLINPGTITIYPNPSSSEIQLELSEGLPVDLEVQVYSVGGALVFQSTISAPTMTIPVSEIGVDGTYFLQIVDSITNEIKGSKQLILN